MERIPFLADYMDIKQLLVVVDAPLGLQSTDGHKEEAKPQWGFIYAPGDVFSWDRARRRFERCGGCEHFCDGVVFALVEGPVIEAFPPGFKIRPILTVQR
jgi:hypothetical protein